MSGASAVGRRGPTRVSEMATSWITENTRILFVAQVPGTASHSQHHSCAQVVGCSRVLGCFAWNSVIYKTMIVYKKYIGFLHLSVVCFWGYDSVLCIIRGLCSWLGEGTCEVPAPAIVTYPIAR